MRASLFLPVLLLLGLYLMSCQVDSGEQKIVGPEPEPRVNYLGRDSITAGDYIGISINTSTDETFEILEGYRKNKTVIYLSAVNNYFADVTDLKNRLKFFDWLVLDETFDTPDGVQLEFVFGKVKSIRLNNGTQLSQWPQVPGSQNAIATDEVLETLYEKLVLLSSSQDYKHKFQRIVLGAKYDYALYDPQKAELPWSFMYDTRAQGITEQVRVYFKDKKVDYILVDRFQQY